MKEIDKKRFENEKLEEFVNSKFGKLLDNDVLWLILIGLMVILLNTMENL